MAWALLSAFCHQCPHLHPLPSVVCNGPLPRKIPYFQVTSSPICDNQSCGIIEDADAYMYPNADRPVRSCTKSVRMNIVRQMNMLYWNMHVLPKNVYIYSVMHHLRDQVRCKTNRFTGNLLELSLTEYRRHAWQQWTPADAISKVTHVHPMPCHRVQGLRRMHSYWDCIEEIA